MKSHTIKSYAKVNVGLQILNQRPDGYHNINTVFQELDFYDTIELKKKIEVVNFIQMLNGLRMIPPIYVFLRLKNFQRNMM